MMKKIKYTVMVIYISIVSTYVENIALIHNVLHWFNHQSLLQLIVVNSKCMPAIRPFQATMARYDKGFNKAAGNLFRQFCFHPSYFQCTVGAQPAFNAWQYVEECDHMVLECQLL